MLSEQGAASAQQLSLSAEAHVDHAGLMLQPACSPQTGGTGVSGEGGGDGGERGAEDDL